MTVGGATVIGPVAFMLPSRNPHLLVASVAGCLLTGVLGAAVGQVQSRVHDRPAAGRTALAGALVGVVAHAFFWLAAWMTQPAIGDFLPVLVGGTTLSLAWFGWLTTPAAVISALLAMAWQTRAWTGRSPAPRDLGWDDDRVGPFCGPGPAAAGRQVRRARRAPDAR